MIEHKTPLMRGFMFIDIIFYMLRKRFDQLAYALFYSILVL